MKAWPSEPENAVNRPRILVVDDDPDILDLVQTGLALNFDVSTARSPEIALRLLDKRGFNAVLIDVEMPELRGPELVEIIRQKSPSTSLILVTAHKQMHTLGEAADCGADAYVTKPFCLNELAREIRSVIERRAEGPKGAGLPSTSG